MGIDKARFRKPVRPGDQILLELVVKRLKTRIGQLEGKAYVDGALVAQAEISFTLVDKEEA